MPSSERMQRRAPSLGRIARRALASGIFCAPALAVAQAPAAPPQPPSAPVPAPAVPVAPAARFVVVLDAAHGGDDPGGHSGDWMEKDFTLALSVRLRSLLAARGIAVVTTRESDLALDAGKRAEIANHAGAEACLNLHASLNGSGIHLFVSSLAPVEPAQFEPWRTAQAAAMTRSLALAGVLNSALLQAGLPVTLGRTALPVVDSMTCPAVAVEVAPERDSSQPPVESLNDPRYQAKVAGALAAALVEWRSGALRTGGREP